MGLNIHSLSYETKLPFQKQKNNPTKKHKSPLPGKKKKNTYLQETFWILLLLVGVEDGSCKYLLDNPYFEHEMETLVLTSFCILKNRTVGKWREPCLQFV